MGWALRPPSPCSGLPVRGLAGRRGSAKGEARLTLRRQVPRVKKKQAGVPGKNRILTDNTNGHSQVPGPTAKPFTDELSCLTLRTTCKIGVNVIFIFKTRR